MKAYEKCAWPTNKTLICIFFVQRSYKVIAAVLVPTDSEMKRRSDKRTREDGKDVPESAVMEMMVNFKLPDETEDFFDEIRYVELSKVKIA